MKKIGVLTTHSTMNYGGILQAYALKTKLESLGFGVEIINYIPDVHNIKKHPFKYIFKRKNGLSRAFFVLKNYKNFKNRKNTFSKFRHNYLSVSTSTISYDDLPDKIKEYDYICCGSDQLWNLNQQDNSSGVYYLPFEKTNTWFTYAISFGDGLKMKRELINSKLPEIKRFDGVSVRENEGYEFLTSNGIDCQLCLDPTMLIDESVWLKFSENFPIINGDYIFVYGYENAYQNYKELKKISIKFSEKYGYKVVNVLMNKDIADKSFYNIYNVGPVQFLNIVKNAKLIITNSYHGIIFSNIFKIPFVVPANKNTGIDNRKETILELLDLTDRVVYEDTNIDLLNISCDIYKNKDKSRIIYNREISINYLKRVLSLEVSDEK